MEEKIDKAIESVLAQAFRAGTMPKPDDALKLSQTILNLSHAKSQLAGVAEARPKKQGAAA